MPSRPQLSPGTSHSTTRYEIEMFNSDSQLWEFHCDCKDLAEAKQRRDGLFLYGLYTDARIVVVSETRRLID